MFSPVLSIHEITGWEPLTWSVNNTCSDAGHRFKFYLRVIPTQVSYVSIKINLSSIKRKLPQLGGGSAWLTPGYDHLNLKVPLCWKRLNHTKNDQPGNYETRLDTL